MQNRGLGGKKEVKHLKSAGEARMSPTTGVYEAGQKQALWHTLSHPFLKSKLVSLIDTSAEPWSYIS
jgi:hypothetical protein